MEFLVCIVDRFFRTVSLDSALPIGAGAVAAAVAAAEQFGAQKGYLLGHTTSAEVVKRRFNQASSDSVGYAAVVFG